MSPESVGLWKYARYRFSIISEAFEFRISFRVSSRADLILIRFIFDSEEGIVTEEVIVFLLTDKPFVWRLIEPSDILSGFPYKVSIIPKASV